MCLRHCPVLIPRHWHLAPPHSGHLWSQLDLDKSTGGPEYRGELALGAMEGDGVHVPKEGSSDVCSEPMGPQEAPPPNLILLNVTIVLG